MVGMGMIDSLQINPQGPDLLKDLYLLLWIHEIRDPGPVCIRHLIDVRYPVILSREYSTAFTGKVRPGMGDHLIFYGRGYSEHSDFILRRSSAHNPGAV